MPGLRTSAIRDAMAVTRSRRAARRFAEESRVPWAQAITSIQRSLDTLSTGVADAIGKGGSASDHEARIERLERRTAGIVAEIIRDEQADAWIARHVERQIVSIRQEIARLDARIEECCAQPGRTGATPEQTAQPEGGARIDPDRFRGMVDEQVGPLGPLVLVYPALSQDGKLVRTGSARRILKLAGIEEDTFNRRDLPRRFPDAAAFEKAVKRECTGEFPYLAHLGPPFFASAYEALREKAQSIEPPEDGQKAQ